MALFKFRWLRRMVRRHTTPIPMNVADLWKRRLSIAYTLLAWNAFGLVLYQIFKGKANWADYHGIPGEAGTSAQQYSKILQVPNAKVYRMSGFTVKDEYDIKNSEREDDQQ